MYHNAQQVMQQDNAGDVNRTISFVTNDIADAVISYYSSFMDKAGWWRDTYDQVGPNDLTFYYKTSDSPSYRVHIIVASSADGTSKVQLLETAGASSWPISDN